MLKLVLVTALLPLLYAVQASIEAELLRREISSAAEATVSTLEHELTKETR